MSDLAEALLTFLILFPLFCFLFMMRIYRHGGENGETPIALMRTHFNKQDWWFSIIFSFFLSALLAYSVLQ